MSHRIRNGAIVLGVAAAVLIVANKEDFFDDRKRTENMLRDQGLMHVAVVTHDVNSTFTATVDNDPSCTVSGMTDATDGAWMLDRFEPDWYPRGEYTYDDPGMPKWPPLKVTVAQVALEHPQICGIN